MFGLGGARSIVGLDIGSSSIKAVELKKIKGEIQVAHLGVERLGSDIVVDSMIVDSGSVSSAISKLCSDRKFSSRLVATAVSGHSVIVKKISMQTVPENEVPDMLQTEATQYIPYDMNDVNSDYQVLTEDPDEPQMDVLLAAV